jgi:hypothetical protein
MADLEARVRGGRSSEEPDTAPGCSDGPLHGAESDEYSSDSSSSSRGELGLLPSPERRARAPEVRRGKRENPWSGSDRIPCPRGCGVLARRDNLSRHLKRCVPPPTPPKSTARPDE